MENKCFSTTKLDSFIAKKMGLKDATIVSAYRGVYYEKNGKDLWEGLDADIIWTKEGKEDEVDKKATEIALLFTNMARQDLMLMADVSNTLFGKKESKSNWADALKKLKKAYPSPKMREARVSLIVNMFMNRVNSLIKDNPSMGLTAQKVCNGFKVGDTVYGGQERLFIDMYNSIMGLSVPENALINEDYKKYFETEKQYMIKNFPALMAFAKRKLMQNEGIILGNRLSFAEEASEDNYSEVSLEDLVDPESSSGETYGYDKDKIASFTNLGNSTRHYLSTIQTDTDDLMQPVYMDPLETHRELSEILVGITDKNEMMDRLSTNPKYSGLYSRLIQDPEALTQFFVDFRKDEQAYFMVTEEKGQMKTKNLNIPEKEKNLGLMYSMVKSRKILNGNSIYDENGIIDTDKMNRLVASVKNYFVDELKKDESHKNLTRLESLKKRQSHELPGILRPDSDLFTDTNRDMTENSKREIQRDKIADTLRAIGFPVKNDTVEKLMDNEEDFVKMIDNLGDLKYGLSNSIGGKSYINVLTGKSKESENLKSTIDKIANLLYKYEFESKTTRAARFHGKTFFSDVLPSFLGTVIQKIKSVVKNDRTEMLKKYLDDTFGYSSIYKNFDGEGRYLIKWLDDLYTENPGQKGSLANLLQYQRTLGNDSKNFEDFTGKDHALSFFKFFFGDEEISDKSKSAWYPVFILGDSGVQKFIHAKRYTIDEIMSGMYDMYRSECKRMSLVKEMNNIADQKGFAKVASLEKTQDKFTMFPFLNNIENPTSLTENEFKDLLGKEMEKNLDEFKKNIRELGLLETVKDSNGNEKICGETGQAVYKYFEKQTNNAKYFKQGQNVIDNVLREYYYNTKFATMNQIKIFNVDSGFFKNVKDFQKRNKHLHASGRPLDVNAEWNGQKVLDELDQTEKVLYFNEIELSLEKVNPEFLDVLDKLYEDGPIKEAIKKTYKANALTDGQGYRSLESYRKVMIMAGQWNNDLENVYTTLNNIRFKAKDGKLTKDEMKEIAKLSAILQPVKPFFYGIERFQLNNQNTGDVLPIPVQHKYAEVLVIPELYPKGSKLRELGMLMEGRSEYGTVNADKKIDMVCATTAVKVGCYGQIDMYGKDAETPVSDLHKTISDAWNNVGGCIHRLPYNNYVIQTNVPSHMYGDNLVGTQLRKLAMAGIDMLGRYNYRFTGLAEGARIKLTDNVYMEHDGQGYKGEDVVSLYNTLISSNILESFDVFNNAVGDVKELSNLLIQNILANQRESMDNLLAYALTGNEDKFLLPLFEANLEHDSAAFLWSIFKKSVNKQKIKGGSFVQASAFGITSGGESSNLKCVTDKSHSNVLYFESEMPWMGRYEHDGVEYELDYNTYCNPDGSLVLGQELPESDPRYGICQSYRNSEGKVCLPLVEEKFPDFLTTVMYRIPTERAYSMVLSRTVRFTPTVAGGTVRLPIQATTIAGFDFDIDKLYFMRKEYEFKKDSFFKKTGLNQNQIEAIMERINKDHPELIESSEYTEDNFTQSQRSDIFAHIYADQDNLGLVKDLRKIRDNSGEYESQWVDINGRNVERRIYKKPLHEYFEQSDFAKRLADQYQMSVKELKNFLFVESAEKLGLLDDSVKTGKTQYLRFNQRKIDEIEGMSRGKLFREAADKLGISLKEVNDSPELKSYDFEKTPIENSRIQRNNLFIDVVKARLTDPSTLKSRLTPGGFDRSKNAAKFMRMLLYAKFDNTSDVYNKAKGMMDTVADPEPEYDPSDPFTNVIFNQMNQVAGKIIGIAANQNVHHALCGLLKSFRLKKGFAFAGHQEENDLLHNTDKVKMAEVEKNVAEFLSSSVDAVKDPVLNYLNINTITADAGIVLARLGYNHEEIGLLFNQPIIKLLCERMFNENENLSEAISYLTNNSSGTVISGMNFKDFENDPNALTLEKMSKCIVLSRNINLGESEKVRKDNEFILTQKAALKLFVDLKKATDDVSSFLQSVRGTAANSVKSTFGGMYAQNERIDGFLEKLESDENTVAFTLETYSGKKTPLDRNLLDETLDKEGNFKKNYLEAIVRNPFGYEQCMYDMYKLCLKNMSRYYPYEHKAYKGMRDSLGSLSRTGSISETIIDSAHEEFLTYLVQSRLSSSSFKGDEKIDGVHTNREFFTKIFPQKFNEWNTVRVFDNKIESPLMDMLRMTTDSEGNDELVIPELLSFDQSQKDILREDWERLFERKSTRAIAEGLYYYCFYKSGFKFGRDSFIHLAPTALKAGINAGTDINGNPRTFGDFLNSLIDKSDDGMNPLDGITDDDLNSFRRLYVLNHYNEPTFTYEPKNGQSLYNLLNRFSRDNEGKRMKEFTICSGEANQGNPGYVQSMGPLVLSKDKNSVRFVPLIKLGSAVYIASGKFGNDFTMSDSETMTYKLVNLSEIGNCPRYDLDLSYLFNFVPGNTLTGQQEPEQLDPSATTGTTGMVDDTDIVKNNMLNTIDHIIETRTSQGMSLEEKLFYEGVKTYIREAVGKDQLSEIQDLLNKKLKESTCFTINSDGTHTNLC